MIAALDLTIGSIIIYVVAGAIIGLIARAIMPGRQSMNLIGTILLGIAAAVVGGILWEAVFPGNDGIAWIGSIIVALVLLWVYGAIAGRGARAGRV